ncbi:ABC transporter permease [Haloprofundus marisrubri]|uniref:ABC transporter permease n=1 Tax=Haloprofundus marisrubri TaxID=1514971 RepID=A0A0W1RDG7_9EURY|nr:ABC transporter permease [Haloprofundus marisrubri]KTG11469.1 ABC transporter permease [Haloprofundus marisrubri]
MKHTESDDTNDIQTDGGMRSIDDSLFTRTSDVPALTRKEKLVRTVDRSLYAPLAVIVRDWRGLIGGTIIALFVFFGTIGTSLVDKPTMMEGPIFLSPFTNWEYPLGTGVMGQDILEQVIHATPAMLQMVLAGALLSVTLGTLIGTVAGYRGGTTDKVLMMATDVVLTIPGLALIIVLASIYQPESPIVVGLILGIDNWPKLARTIRSQVLSIREESYTEASRIMGLSQFHILRKDVISNLMPYISVNFANSARLIIFESVGLYFLGILPFTTLNWGVMMNEAYAGADLTSMQEIHWLLVPMALIMIVSLGFILFAQALDRIFNVRLRARHEKTAGGDAQ